MAEQQLPTIRIVKFRTTYHKVPGQTELVARDWVSYSPIHDPKAVTEEQVKFLIPPETEADMRGADPGTKLAYMRSMWAQIEPAYKAFKEGTEVPLDGTPLSAWAGVTPEQIEVLRLSQIKTVQHVAAMTESQMNKVMLPGIRALKQTAIEYLASRESVAQAEEVASLKAQLETLAQMMADRQDAEGEEAPAKRGPGRPPKVKEAA